MKASLLTQLPCTGSRAHSKWTPAAAPRSPRSIAPYHSATASAPSSARSTAGPAYVSLITPTTLVHRTERPHPQLRNHLEVVDCRHIIIN